MDAIIISKSDYLEVSEYVYRVVNDYDYSIVRKEISNDLIRYKPYSIKNKIRIITCQNSAYIDEKSDRLDICIINSELENLFVIEYVIEKYTVDHIIITIYT